MRCCGWWRRWSEGKGGGGGEIYQGEFIAIDFLLAGEGRHILFSAMFLCRLC